MEIHPSGSTVDVQFQRGDRRHMSQGNLTAAIRIVALAHHGSPVLTVESYARLVAVLTTMKRHPSQIAPPNVWLFAPFGIGNDGSLDLCRCPPIFSVHRRFSPIHIVDGLDGRKRLLRSLIRQETSGSHQPIRLGIVWLKLRRWGVLMNPQPG